MGYQIKALANRQSEEGGKKLPKALEIASSHKFLRCRQIEAVQQS